MTKQEPRPGPLPLLLIPGTLCDARVFGALRARLGGRALRDVTVAGADNAAGLAARILAQAPARFAAVGFSLGGIVALALAEAAPARVAGLALIAANARPDPPERAAQRRADLARAQVLGQGRFASEQLWPLYTPLDPGAGDPSRDGLRALIVAMAAATPPEAFAAQTEIAISRADARLWLPFYAAPVLALGGAEDRINPPDRQHEIAALAPRAACHIVPGAGHFVLIEAAAETAAALGAWIADLEEHSVS